MRKIQSADCGGRYSRFENGSRFWSGLSTKMEPAMCFIYMCDWVDVLLLYIPMCTNMYLSTGARSTSDMSSV